MSTETPSGIPVHVVRDVAYVEDGTPRQKLDIYFPSRSRPGRPLVVYAHGGGWQRRSKASHTHIGMALAERGFATAVISYRVSGMSWMDGLLFNLFPAAILSGLVSFASLAVTQNLSSAGSVFQWTLGGTYLSLLGMRTWRRLTQEPIVKWPAHRDDLAAALRFLSHAAQPGQPLARYYDPHNIFVLGHSAGAHMLMMTTLDSAVMAAHNLAIAPADPAVVSAVGAKAVALAEAGGLSELSRPPLGSDLASPPVDASGRDDLAKLVSSHSIGVPLTTPDRHSPLGTVRGIIPVSPPCVANAMVDWTLAYVMYIRPVFGLDPAAWPGSFPDGLIRHEIDAGTLAKPALLLPTAQPGWDFGLDQQAVDLKPLLEEGGIPHAYITVPESNHESAISYIHRSGSSARKVLLPAVELWIEHFGKKDE